MNHANLPWHLCFANLFLVKNLARVHEPKRIQTRLYSPHDLYWRFTDLSPKKFLLSETNTVLALIMLVLG